MLFHPVKVQSAEFYSVLKSCSAFGEETLLNLNCSQNLRKVLHIQLNREPIPNPKPQEPLIHNLNLKLQKQAGQNSHLGPFQGTMTLTKQICQNE